MPPGRARRVIDGGCAGPVPRRLRSPSRRGGDLGADSSPAAAGVGEAGGLEGGVCRGGVGTPCPPRSGCPRGLVPVFADSTGGRRATGAAVGRAPPCPSTGEWAPAGGAGAP